MIVTIPKVEEHNGSPLNLMTIEISDKCPKCGAKRGTKVFNGFSFDGSRRLIVTQWENECGHVDTYAEVREEYYNTPIKGKTLKEHLSNGLSRQIMEATGRFQFVKEEPEMSMMTFWDNYCEKEYSIKTDWTLEKLIQWIVNFYSEDYEWRGEQKTQRKIRSALGLD